MSALAHKLSKLIKILSTRGWCRAFLKHRVAAGAEHAGALRHIGRMGTVVDIGANRGQFALAVRAESPAAIIHSFEPLAKPAAVYRQVFDGDQFAFLHPAAIGPEQGKVTIHISARDDSSSLLPIAKKQNEVFPGTAEIGTDEVDVGPLQAFIAAGDIVTPALLKLDVQGFELEALRGSAQLLDCFKYVYAECSFIEMYEGQAFADAVIAWLKEHGFLIVGVYNVNHDANGAPVQADFLFERRSQAA